MQPVLSTSHKINYKVGSLYAVITSFLLSIQEPFSFLAAKQLSVLQFIFLIQVALLISIPLVTVRATNRRDLISLLGNVKNYGKFGVLFAIGMSGLVLFKLGLSKAHPIIISAIINLMPFWAALVAQSRIQSANSSIAGNIFWLLGGRVSWRNGDRLESSWRGRATELDPTR